MSDIRRDRWGRPLIKQQDGSEVAYTRVSTLAKKLDDGSALIEWKADITALGVARNRSVYNRLCALASASGDPRASHRKELRSLVDTAFKAGGGEKAADAGTSIHTFCELIDKGADLRYVPPEFEGPLEAYRKAMGWLRVIDTEQFVVCDELRAAGSYDKTVMLPSGVVIVADVKTGAHEPSYPNGVTTQLAMYAHSVPYDMDTGERGENYPSFDNTRGLLIHLPLNPVDGQYRCDLYMLPLDQGWERAKAAARVRDMPKIKIERVQH